MANRTGIAGLIENIRLHIAAYRQALKIVARDKEQSRGQYADMELAQRPDLVLEIGNELLITGELIKTTRHLANSLGRVVLIDQILSKEGTNIKASAFGIQVDVTTQVAQHMRAAFLKREQGNRLDDNAAQVI